MVTSNGCDILVIDPALMDYRVGLWNDLSKVLTLKLYCGYVQVDDNYAFELEKVKVENYLGLQWYSGVLAGLIKHKPRKVLISFDSKNLTMWALLFFSKVLRIDCYIFGHGLFKTGNYLFIRRTLYFLLLRFCTKYLCYNELVYQSLNSLNVGKLYNIDNVINNEYPIFPSAKTGKEHGVLFIGRNRPGAEIELLIRAIRFINNKIDAGIKLHIIGGGAGLKELCKGVPDVMLYGEIFDKKIISDISTECRIGVYAGDAGLSVLHYMSLSLPVIIHSSFSLHMGPEPSSVINGYNGFVFNRLDFNSLVFVITKAFALNVNEYIVIANNSFLTYEKKVKPLTYSDRILMALDEYA